MRPDWLACVALTCTTYSRRLGRTYLDLVREVRVQRAYQLLVSRPQCSISEIAESAGYTTRTMCRHFVKVLGATPSELRRRVPVGRRMPEKLAARGSSRVTRRRALG